MTQRPAWFNDSQFSFESKSMDMDGSTVHYLDEIRKWWPGT